VRESLHNQPLKKRNVQIIAGTPLKRETVVINFGTKLPAVTVSMLIPMKQEKGNADLWSPIKMVGPSSDPV